MFKKLANKIASFLSSHPRLFGIAVGFAVTLALEVAIGIIGIQQAHAMAC